MAFPNPADSSTTPAPSALRIVSLIPSATEIVALLGLQDYLVGRSHECDFPSAVKALPVCTQPKFNPDGTSLEIHDRVTNLLQSALSVYRVDTDKLQHLQPTHIVTQAQCDVCAVSLGDVEQAVATLLGDSQPQVISLQPRVLADVWNDIQQVAQTLGVEPTALDQLKQRVENCRIKTQPLPDSARPSIVCIEWIEPLMAAGNWIPELVELAGGQLPRSPLPLAPDSADLAADMPNSPFGSVGEHSPWLAWDTLQAADPDVLVLLPCGFDLERTRQEAQVLLQHPAWAGLKAVQQGQVYCTDGNQYFNRPGPRLVDSLEILAEILHPELFQFGYEGAGWQRLSA